MQQDPVDDSTNMVMLTAADHFLDELVKIIPHLDKEAGCDNLDEPEQLCKQQLEVLREQESAQRKWNSGDYRNWMLMKGLNPPADRHYNLPPEEIERRLKVQKGSNTKEPVERQMYTTQHDYFQQSLLGNQLHQPLPNDLPRLRMQIECQRIQTLQRDLFLCMARNDLFSSHMEEVQKFSVGGVDTNNVFPSISVPNSVRKIYLSPKVVNRLESKHISVVSLAYAKGSRVRKNIFVISSPGNGGSSSEGTRSTLTAGNNNHRETIVSYNDILEVILDNQVHVHCTGIFEVLSNLSIGPENIVLIAANGEEMETFMSGSVRMGNFILPNVHYCPDLGNRIIVSGSMLDNDDYGYQFCRRKFTVKDLKNDTTVGEGRLVDGNYVLDYLKISGDRTRVPQQQPGLVTTVWNAVCSAFHRLGLNPQGAPM